MESPCHRGVELRPVTEDKTCVTCDHVHQAVKYFACPAGGCKRRYNSEGKPYTEPKAVEPKPAAKVTKTKAKE